MNDDVFTDRAESFEELQWFTDGALLEWIASHLHDWGDTIVDIGTGTGSLIPHLSSMFSKVMAFEPNREMYARALRFGKEDNVILFNEDFECFEKQKPQTDIVLFKNSIHHIGHYQEILNRALDLASYAVAALEVIGPNEDCAAFAKQIVLEKEPTRFPNSFLASTLGRYTSFPGYRTHSLYYDQWISIDDWLSNGPLSSNQISRVSSLINNADPRVRDAMQIHRHNGKLRMLRRNELFIIIKKHAYAQ